MEPVFTLFGKSRMLSDIYGICGINEKHHSNRSFSLLENSHKCLENIKIKFNKVFWKPYYPHNSIKGVTPHQHIIW